jgi:hypothetical protein
MEFNEVGDWKKANRGWRQKANKERHERIIAVLISSAPTPLPRSLITLSSVFHPAHLARPSDEVFRNNGQHYQNGRNAVGGCGIVYSITCPYIHLFIRSACQHAQGLDVRTCAPSVLSLSYCAQCSDSQSSSMQPSLPTCLGGPLHRFGPPGSGAARVSWLGGVGYRLGISGIG